MCFFTVFMFLYCTAIGTYKLPSDFFETTRYLRNYKTRNRNPSFNFYETIDRPITSIFICLFITLLIMFSVSCVESVILPCHNAIYQQYVYIFVRFSLLKVSALLSKAQAESLVTETGGCLTRQMVRESSFKYFLFRQRN